MLCQKCNKNEATTRILENINGVKNEYYLCSKCASGYYSHGNSFVDFDKMLSNMFFEPERFTAYNETKCQSCGADLKFLEETGKVGCADCYKALSGSLAPYIEKLHHGLEYKGRIPEKAGEKLKKKREIDNLKAALNSAVSAQDYEKAAVIRDKIKELEGNI